MEVQATGEAFSPQKRTPSILQNMKLLIFFLFLWVVFALFDPDPDPAKQSQCGSGSATLAYLLESQRFFPVFNSPCMFLGTLIQH
jgi:hypothetical protein